MIEDTECLRLGEAWPRPQLAHSQQRLPTLLQVTILRSESEVWAELPTVHIDTAHGC